MKAIEDAELDEMRDDMRLGAKAMRAFLAYQGENPVFEKKAKIGAVFVTTYIRAHATTANRIIAEVAAERLAREVGDGDAIRRLKQA